MQSRESGRSSSVVVSESALRTALDVIMRESLRPFSAGLSALYAVFAVSHGLVQPAAVAAVMIPVAAGTAALLLGLYLGLGRWSMPSRWAHPVAAGMAGLVLLNSLLHLFLLSNPQQTTNLMLLAIGVGCFFLSTAWLALVLVATIGGWGLVVWGATPSPSWVHFGFGLFSATVLSVLVHTVRVRTFRRLEELRLQDERHQRELEAAVQAAQQSEERYRGLIETASDVIFTLSTDGTIMSLNPAFEAITGWSRAEWLGKPFVHILYPDDFPLALELLQGVLQGEAPPIFELRVVAKAGEYLVGEFRATPQIRDGQVVGVFGIARDITERKQMVKALRQSEARYRTVSELVSDYAYAVRLEPDGRGTLEWVTEAFSRITGFTVQDLAAGMGLDRIIHPEDMPRVCQRLRVLFSGQPGVSEHRIVTKSGEVRWLRDYSSPEWDPAQGCVARIIGAGHDITERKQAEEQLKESEVRLRLLTELIPQQVWSALPEGSFDYVNQRWLEYTGLTLEEAQGDGWTSILLPEDRERVVRAWRDAIARGIMYEAEEQHHGADGKYRWFLVRALPLRDPAGRITKWYGTNTDIEDRKCAEEALGQLQAELAHVSRVVTMGEMAASIAHEVNQPLGAIVGNADICLRWLASETPNLSQVCDALSDIIKDGHRASEVIARIRALVKREASRRTSLNINEVVREAIALASHEVQRKRVTLRAELAADLPSVLGDRVQLGQVMLNLMMNGIEAMSGVEGRVGELVIRSGRDDAGGVLIAVRDCGVGIDPQEAKRMFAAFYTTKLGGMGMGLAICRSIVEAHGGRLWAVPNAGPGATVQFTLPSVCEEER